MRKLRWLMLFVIFAFFGCFGEIIIGFLYEYVFVHRLWVYYNGGHTSVESWFLFGLAGIFGFKVFLKALNWRGYEIVSK